MASFKRPYRGVFPVAPTIFSEDGELDLEGQRRCIDFMIDAGSHGICILANFSEQFVLTDQERETVMHTMLDHAPGGEPVARPRTASRLLHHPHRRPPDP